MSAEQNNTPNPRAFFNADISAPAFKNHLIRKTLLNRVLSSNKKLTLIKAPPGYGKTSFMKQLSDKQSEPCIWLNIRNTDNDPMNLLHKLNSALSISEQASSNDLNATGAEPVAASMSNPSIPLWTRSLIDLINKQPRMLIFLNDADLIQSPEAIEAVNLVLQMSHAGVQFFLTGNSAMPFSFSHLLIENQILHINQDDLSFSARDIQAMFALLQSKELDDQQAQQLMALTEGWPAAAFYMASTLQTDAALTRFIADATLKQQAFDRFFIERVFEQQSEETRQLLLRLSQLDRFNLALCQALSDSPEQCQAFWSYVEQHTFITPIDARGQWYRFHQLFALFLKHRSQLAFSADMREQWLMKAAHYFHQTEAIEEAIPLALQAKHFTEAAHWLEQAFPTIVVGMGKHQTYHQWYNTLPAEIIKAFPRLRIGSIWAQVAKRQFLNVAQQLQWLITHKSDYPDTIQQEIMRTAGLVHCCMEGLKDNAEKAAPLVDAWITRWQTAASYTDARQRDYEMGLAYLIKGYCAKCLSSFQEARQALHQSINHLNAFGSFYGMTLAQSLLAVTYAKQGFHHEARREAQEAYQLAKQKLGEKSHNGFGLAALLAAIHYEHDEIEAARPLLKETLPYLKEQSPSDLLIAAFETQARLLVHDQSHEEASGFLKDAIKWAETQSLPRLSYKLLDELIVTLIRRQRFSEAERYASQYDLILRGAEDFMINESRHNIASRSIIYCLWQRKAFTESGKILQQLLSRAEQKGQLRRQAEWLKLTAINYHFCRQDDQALAASRRLLDISAPQQYVRLWLDEVLCQPLLNLLGDNASQLALNPETQAFYQKLCKKMQPANKLAQNLIEPLTAKEIEIIKALAEGLPNKVIAEKLLVSLGTLKWHLHNIYGKLNVKNRTQALIKAKAEGYL